MFKTITSRDLEMLRNEKEIMIVDVREQDEYDSGHIPGVNHVPLSGFPENIHLIDQTKENYIVCASGGRSSMASEFLTQKGYDIINVQGGMMMWRGELE